MSLFLKGELTALNHNRVTTEGASFFYISDNCQKFSDYLFPIPVWDSSIVSPQLGIIIEQSPLLAWTRQEIQWRQIFADFKGRRYYLIYFMNTLRVIDELGLEVSEITVLLFLYKKFTRPTRTIDVFDLQISFCCSNDAIYYFELIDDIEIDICIEI